MGRRATRRRHKKKHAKHNIKKCHSDPEELRECRDGNTVVGDKCDSVDDLALLDYYNNAVSCNDEMEVTKRLSSLNVSTVSCCGADHFCSTVMTSDVETIYSEFPPFPATFTDSNLPGEIVPSERLKERQMRKRSSKRSRKRTKKPRSTCKCSLPDETNSRHRKPILEPINWVQSSTVPQTTGADQSSLSHSECCDCNLSSDLSSRALTESDTPILDDIIMTEHQEDQSNTTCEVLKDGYEPATPSPIGPDHTHTRRISDVSADSTSDSGCDGDDEESSAELLGSMKVARATGSTNGNVGAMRRGFKPWHGGKFEDDGGFSSVEEMYDDEEGSRFISKTIGKGEDTEFKHPLQCGMKGVVNSLDPGQLTANSETGLQQTPKGKKKVVHLISSPQDLHSRIKNFVQFSPELELTLPLMSRPLCRTASSLADVYNLDCEMCYQKRRLPVASPVLRKTYCTHVPTTNEDIEAVLENHRREVINSSISVRKSRKPTLPVQVPMSILHTKNIVGGDASPIGQSNVGNRMLQGMGWRPGSGLGRYSTGIQSPVFAEVRPKSYGLGFAT